MNPKQPVKPFLEITKNEKYPHILDVDLLVNQENFRLYDFFHCHLVVYPFSRKIFSDHINIHPFSEYAKDISSKRTSVYSPLANSAPQFFGLLLMIGLTILIKLFTNVQLLENSEVVLSLFGVYLVGKDFWDDIENFLQRITKNWRLRYQDSYYSHELQRNTTLMRYTNLAKQERYGYAIVLPEKMDYIMASNSCTIRLLFDTQDFREWTGEKSHLLSIRIEPSLVDEFEQRGYMVGIKIAFGKRHLFWESGYEMFQSIKNKEAGALSAKEEWLKESVVARKIWALGKLRHQSNLLIMDNRRIVDFQL